MEPQMNADERRSNQAMAGLSASIGVHLPFIILSVCIGGCASHKHPSTQPVSAYERQERALKDPFGYSPEVGRSDISGGGVQQLDRKAMKKDVDHVLNP
jgi:hypothetical protein